jgi:hypothetical protein
MVDGYDLPALPLFFAPFIPKPGIDNPRWLMAYICSLGSEDRFIDAPLAV